ncbi:MAG: hypothetical protein HC888_19040, partial [Candidatus Competibacteraceae bacterium]|nr:hypothetical protein [Candidatus Competibacteraceae bacterium]
MIGSQTRACLIDHARIGRAERIEIPAQASGESVLQIDVEDVVARLFQHTVFGVAARHLPDAVAGERSAQTENSPWHIIGELPDPWTQFREVELHVGNRHAE